MNKIKSYFLNYLKKSSKFKIISDILFYLFIILLLIPSSRKQLSESIIRATLLKPKFIAENNYQSLQNEDKYIIIEDLNRSTYKIGDFQGQVIVINFWATWCPPCRAEMPAFQKLYNKYGQRMTFLFITDDDPGKVQRYLSEFNFKLPVYYFKSEPTQRFSITSIPTTFVVNKKGEIVINKKGAANWNSTAFKAKLDGLIDEGQ